MDPTHAHTHMQYSPEHARQGTASDRRHGVVTPIPSGPFFPSLLYTVSSRITIVDRHHSLAGDLVVIVRLVGSF